MVVDSEIFSSIQDSLLSDTFSTLVLPSETKSPSLTVPCASASFLFLPSCVIFPIVKLKHLYLKINKCQIIQKCLRQKVEVLSDPSPHTPEITINSLDISCLSRFFALLTCIIHGNIILPFSNLPLSLDKYPSTLAWHLFIYSAPFFMGLTFPSTSPMTEWRQGTLTCVFPGSFNIGSTKSHCPNGLY